MKLRQSDTAGFTLVELLIVVTIIGILAAVAIPSYFRWLQKGYNASAVTDLKVLRSHLEAYYADHESYP